MLKAPFILKFFSLANTKTGEAHNGWGYVGYDVANGVYSLTGSAGPLCDNSKIKGRDKDNTFSVTNAGLPMYYENTSTRVFASTQLGTTDATDGNYPDLPIYLYIAQGGYRSLRGRVQDTYWAPESTPQTTVEPAGGPYVSTVVGNMWIPWSTSTAPQF